MAGLAYIAVCPYTRLSEKQKIVLITYFQQQPMDLRFQACANGKRIISSCFPEIWINEFKY